MTFKSNKINNANNYSANTRRLSEILNREGYMSLQVIAKGYQVDSNGAFQRGLSEPTTLEYIQLWERLHNPDFCNNKFISVCENALSNGTYPPIEELKLECRLIGIYVDLDFQEEIYIHKDIACDFACGLSPAFRVYCLQKLSLSSDSKTLNFASEEDFIVSKTTVAQAAKKDAFNKYLSDIRLCNFATNEKPEYNYCIRGRLKIKN